jgi:hypothetical protein
MEKKIPALPYERYIESFVKIFGQNPVSKLKKILDESPLEMVDDNLVDLALAELIPEYGHALENSTPVPLNMITKPVRKIL